MADENQTHGLEHRSPGAMRSFRYVVADVFTDTPLAGNPLAVFTDARDLDGETMQPLARELGPLRDGVRAAAAGRRRRADPDLHPADELPFAGHPCLGTAFVLGAPLQLPTIVLETGSGIVPVELERDESAGSSSAGCRSRCRRSSPTSAPTRCSPPSASAARAARRALRQRPPARVVVLGRRRTSPRSRPDFNALTALGFLGGRCRAATARAGSPHVLAARRRRRGRGDGIGRGPARLPPRPARTSFPGARRSSSSRATEIGRPSTSTRAPPAGDAIDRVEVGGPAVTVARGEFKVP